MTLSSSILKYILFADDSTIYQSHSNIQTLISTFNSELQLIATWLSANKLTINTNKTHFMIMHRHKRLMYPLPPLYINNQVLTEVDSTSFLGIIIDKQLNWSKHILHLRNKIAKYCGILYLTRNCLNKKSMLLLYYSLIYPNLIYCNTIWGASSNQALKPLTIIQKRVIRTIEGLRKRDHTNDTFYKYKILKLEDINHYISSTFVFKSLNGLTFHNFFEYQDSQRYHTRNRTNLKLPFALSSQSQSSIRYNGPKLYNSLPEGIKNKPSLNTFKTCLKLHLINTCNTNHR